jgi:hypothetical protein
MKIITEKKKRNQNREGIEREETLEGREHASFGEEDGRSDEAAEPQFCAIVNVNVIVNE